MERPSPSFSWDYIFIISLQVFGKTLREGFSMTKLLFCLGEMKLDVFKTLAFVRVDTGKIQLLTLFFIT